MDRALIRNALIVSACAGAFLIAGKPAKAEVNWVLANMAAETSECVVYFAIVAKGLRDAKEPDAAARYDAASDRLHESALRATKLAGLKLETVEANIKLATQTMFDRIDRNMANAAILTADYGQLCKTIYEKPDERVRYWVDWLSRQEQKR